MHQGSKINLYDALDIFIEHLNDIRQACIENCDYQLSLVKPPDVSKCRTYELFWVKANVYAYRRKQILETYSSQIRAIDIKKLPPRKGAIQKLDIERAKNYPIARILNVEGKRGNVSCPFHTDRTPSFQIKKNNTFTCYSCGEYGDSIHLYQKLHNCSFVEAVNQLTK